MKTLLTAILLATTGLSVLAQSSDVIGTTIVNGKMVELMRDNTWRFVDQTPVDADCTAVTTILQVCDPNGQLNALDTTGTEFIRQYRLNARSYAGIIVEELGAADGVDMEFMRSAVIENAAMFTGVTPAEIPIFGVEALTVDGNPAEKITYGAKYNDLDFVFQNTIVNSTNYNIQIVLWTVTDKMTDSAKATNDAFVERLRIKFPEG